MSVYVVEVDCENICERVIPVGLVPFVWERKREREREGERKRERAREKEGERERGRGRES